MRALIAPLSLVLVLGLASGCGGDDEDGSGGSDSLAGVPWVVSSGIDVAGWEAVAPSAKFEDGTVGGSTGCNRYTASYTVDGDALELGQIVSTRMACAPPADAVEREYLAALGRVAEWRSEASELVLLDADGAELLRYAPASPLGDWEVTAFQTGTALASPIAGTKLTATFGDDGSLTGSSGCNRYTTTFTLDQRQIQIEEPAGTRKLCPEPAGVMEQEAAYLAALPAAASYRVDGGSLALLAVDGTIVASFVRPDTP